MWGCPEEDDGEQVPRGQAADLVSDRRPTDEGRNGARGTADDDIARRRPLEPERIDEDVAQQTNLREQHGEWVHKNQEDGACNEREGDAEGQCRSWRDHAARDWAPGSATHEWV